MCGRRVLLNHSGSFSCRNKKAMNHSTQIRPLLPSDWPVVKKIYQQGIETGIATFETEVPDWAYWNNKYLTFCRFVAAEQSLVLGWVTLSPVSTRPVYKGVAEVSLYVAQEARGKGIGKALLHHLVTASEKAGIWTLQSAIFPENKASIHLHQLAGFRVVGIREKIGQRHGVWYDNVFLERRKKEELQNIE